MVAARVPRAQGTVLERIAKHEFPMARVEHVARRSWNWQRGLQHLNHYSCESEAAVIGTDAAAKCGTPPASRDAAARTNASPVHEQRVSPPPTVLCACRWLCLSALASVIEYVEGPDLRAASFVKGTLKITYATSEGSMLLDHATIQNLEILRNLRTGSTKASLYGVLNHCKTAAGGRMLRSSLIQPSTDLDTIQMRLEATAELLLREEAQIDLAKNLLNFKE